MGKNVCLLLLSDAIVSDQMVTYVCRWVLTDFICLVVLPHMEHWSWFI